MNDCIPLEQSDPQLAQLLQQVVQGEHPVRSINHTNESIAFTYRDGSYRRSSVHGVFTINSRGQRLITPAERNEPCKCGSGKKYKQCCQSKRYPSQAT